MKMYKDVLLTKSERAIWMILFLCPKGNYFTLLPTQNESLNLSEHGENSLEQTLINEDFNKDKKSQGNIITLEPGFDLTDDEIMKFKLWPLGIIPYYIDILSFSDKVLRDKIRSFLNMVNGLTSVKFLELPSPPQDDVTRWVFFINRRGMLGCADHSIKKFTTRGVQQVILGYECMGTGSELAEAVLSIVGVPAQHTSPDRDQYIKILNANIMPDKQYLFDKLKDDEWLFHDVKYDFASAGHFPSYKHSSAGRATIEMKENYLDILVGEANKLSGNDINKIQMLYNYISRKKQNITDCHNMFVPGANFNTYKPKKERLRPRKKPIKYLGAPKEHNPENIDSKQSAGVSVEGEDTDNVNVTSNAESDDTNQKLSLGVMNIRDDNNNIIQQKLKFQKSAFNKDPLSLLSDYKTDGI